MKSTIQSRLSENLIDTDEAIQEILALDERLFSVKRERVGYGTWRISLWTNNYAVGDTISEMLAHKTFITHDEYAEYSISDFLSDFKEDLTFRLDEF